MFGVVPYFSYFYALNWWFCCLKWPTSVVLKCCVAFLRARKLCPTLCNRMNYTVHGILQSRTLDWVAFSLLQGIFPTQGLNPGLPHCQLILYQLSHKRRLGKTGRWAQLLVADSVHPGQSLRICISNSFPMMLMLLV